MILIFASILNIILNYVLITAGLKVGMINAVYGAVFATIISRSVYVALLGIFRKR